MMSGRTPLPARVPFFYGWVVVFAAAVYGSFLLGSAQFALSAFIVPMREDLGWSASTILWALAVRMLGGGLLGPVIGPLLDRPRTARFLMPLGGLLLGVSLMSVHWVHSPIWFFLTYGFLGALAFALINTTMWDSVVVKWFVRKRARALVWVSFGPSSASMIFPLLVTFLILGLGWRDAWLWYGILTVVVLVPVGLLARGMPEEVGLFPDGASDPVTAGTGRGVLTENVSLNRRQAMRTPAFWLIGVAFALTQFGINAFQAHWIPYFIGLGFSATVAATAVSVYGLSNVVTRVMWGYLVSRFSTHRLIVWHTIMAGLGLGLVLSIQNLVMLYAWAIFHGLFLGSYNYLHALLTAQYFGRAHIGAIRGAMLAPASVLRGVGPPLLDSLRGVGGSYTLPFLFVWGVWGAVTVAIASARRPSAEAPAQQERAEA